MVFGYQKVVFGYQKVVFNYAKRLIYAIFHPLKRYKTLINEANLNGERRSRAAFAQFFYFFLLFQKRDSANKKSLPTGRLLFNFYL